MENFISFPIIYFGLVAMLACCGGYLVFHRRLSPFAWILIFASIVPVEIMFEQYHVTSNKREAKQQATRDLNSHAHKLTGLLGEHLAAVEGLAAYIGTNPDIDRETFEQISARIFPRHPYLINVAAAPDLVISLLYPLQGNEAALGLDYRLEPSQRGAVFRARDTGTTVLAGPLDLVQGGKALIGRLPVFTTGAYGESKFWGIISATIDAEKIFAAAGLGRAEGLEIAIRGTNGTGSSGPVFFGSDTTQQDSGLARVAVTITVASGAWEMIAFYPELEGLAQGVWFLRICALLLIAGWLTTLEQRRRGRDNQKFYEQSIRVSERLLKEAGKLAGVVGWRLHHDSDRVHFTEGAGKLVGLAQADEITARKVLELLEPRYRETLNHAMRNTFKTGNGFDIELKVRVLRGRRPRWLRIMGTPEWESGRVVAVSGAMQDITERKEFIETIENQATHDTLTGLPNRRQFDQLLEHETAQAKRNDNKLAVLFIDLDDFKSVNDNLGHSGGDELLVEAAGRIQSCVRESDIVARLSGDEFAVLLPVIEAPAAASVVAAKIVAAMNQPFEIQSRQVFSSASVGIAVFDDDGSDAENLLTNADQAMYEVKKSLRNDFTFFTAELQQRSEERHRLFNKLSLAVAEQRLEVFYQPIVPLDPASPVACEALVRWQEDGEYVSPDAFVPLAEETGLIIEIDRFVMQRATAFMHALQTRGLPPPALSVNVSPRIFFDRAGELDRWCEHVRTCASRTDLTLEITERLLTQDTPQASVVLQQLRASGIKVAIDDFGTGYSSLSYLAKFPVDTLKIDAFFVSKIPQDHSAITLTETILGLARELGLHAVAEGVETAEQLSFLKERNCDSVQGYLFAKPLQSEEFAEWLWKYEEVRRSNKTGEGIVANLL